MFASGRRLVPPPAQAGDAARRFTRRRTGVWRRALLVVAAVALLSAPLVGDATAADRGPGDVRVTAQGGSQAGSLHAPVAPLAAQPSPASLSTTGIAQVGNDSTTTTTSEDGSASETATPTPDGTPVPTENGTATATATATATDSPEPTDTATPTESSTPTETDATPSATTAGTPVFTISNVSAPEGVRVGGEVLVRATVTNRGAAGTERVNYSLAGATVASEDVSLSAGESTRVSFRTDVSTLEPGTYVHGVRNVTGHGVAHRLRVTPDVDFGVTDLDAPTELSRGEPYVVLATVENPAETAITRNVSYVFDGVTVATKRVTVVAGATERVAFESSVGDLEAATGEIANGSTHTHAVVTDGESSAGGEVLVRRGASADPSTLAVEEFRAGDDLRPGETMQVNVSVRNVGEAVFEGQITYRIGDAPVDTTWVRVPVGERHDLSFTVTHDAIDRRDVLEAAGETSHGVWVGTADLQTRPVNVHGPLSTPTPTGTVTFTDDAGSRDGTGESGSGSATESTPPESCERGLLTPCGGTGLDETTLTLVGIATSMVGILYEMVNG